jgi:two-component system, cell cycle sensor histidine kinase and response regulator CckA
MKSLQSPLHRNPPIHSVATSEFPPPAKVCEPGPTVLVVDDDSMVRDLETEILRLQGYTVLEADSAAEALRVAASIRTIHLLITDLMMPELDGLELTRRFRKVHPKTPVLMVSGSLPMLRVRSIPDMDRFDFLAKPFQFNELLHKVRTLLDTVAPLPIRKDVPARPRGRPWCCD